MRKSLFQIWQTKLSKTFTSEVINLSKIFLNEGRFTKRETAKYNDGHKRLLTGAQIEESFPNDVKKSILGSIRWKKPKMQLWPQKASMSSSKGVMSTQCFSQILAIIPKKNPSISPPFLQPNLALGKISFVREISKYRDIRLITPFLIRKKSQKWCFKISTQIKL